MIQGLAPPSAHNLFLIRSFDLLNQCVDLGRTEFSAELGHVPLPVADHISEIFFGHRPGLFRAKGGPREMPSFACLAVTLGAVRLKNRIRGQAVLGRLGQRGRKQKSRKHGTIDSECLQYAPRQSSITPLILFYRNRLLFEKLLKKIGR